MKIEHIVYLGEKKEASLIVLAAPANSPERVLKYGVGFRKRIGKDMAPKIAKHLVTIYPDLFQIETEDQSDEDAFKEGFNSLLLVYGDIGATKIADILKKTMTVFRTRLKIGNE